MRRSAVAASSSCAPAGKARTRASAEAPARGAGRRRIKAGKSVRFKGRIARKFAKIPAGGKLYELQVRRPDGGWAVVRPSRFARRFLDRPWAE